MSQTMQVLRRFHRAVQDYAADRVRVVATSALRDAKNSRAFLDWVRTATGWKVEVISGLEEGRLIHLGILSNARIAHSRALLIDLGGGSCELTLSIDGHIDDMVSLPIGAVRLTQTFLHHDPPKKKELEQMRGIIQREVSRIRKRITHARLQITIATSGTPAALASLYAAKVRGYNDSKPQTVPQDSGGEVAEGIEPAQPGATAGAAGDRTAARRNHHRRRHGLRRTHAAVQSASFRYLPLGLRDGLLAQMMADYNGSAAMRERVESERHDALIAVGQTLRRRPDLCAAHSRPHHAAVSPLAIGAPVAAAIRRLAGGRGHAARGGRVHQSLGAAPSHLLRHRPLGNLRLHADAAPHHCGHSALCRQVAALADTTASFVCCRQPTRSMFRRRSLCCAWRVLWTRDAGLRCASCRYAFIRTAASA